MKRSLITTAVASLGIVAVMLFAGASTGANADGKSLFVANKCNSCHAVAAQGVAKAGGEGPELSGVGLRHNAVWITKYLQKNADLNGKKHLKKFKGTDADLGVLAAWLAAQKKKQ